jgi:CRISPR type IV-associated DEAD/DEAH-box helicase Csf4
VPGWESDTSGHEIEPTLSAALTDALHDWPATDVVADTDQKGSVKVTCLIDHAAHETLASIAQRAGVAEHRIASALLAWMATRDGGAAGRDSILAELLSISGRVPRPEQNIFFNNVCQGLAAGAIGITEAATGTGKTAATIAAAVAALRAHPGDRAVITCPSLMLVRDHEETARAMGLEDGLRVVIGKREFVSPTEINDIIEKKLTKSTPDRVAAVAQWIKKGGQPLAHGLQKRWLTATLVSIAPDFPVEAACIPDGAAANDPGLLEYRAQFDVEKEYQHESEIIICSHAMLAVDLRRRIAVSGKNEEVQAGRNSVSALKKQASKEKKDDGRASKATLAQVNEETAALHHLATQISQDQGVLPDYQWVFVDEAHLFEQSLSGALSDYLSVNTLVRKCKECVKTGTLSKKSANNIQRLGAKLQQFSVRAGEDISVHGSTDVIRIEIKKIFAEMHAALRAGKRNVPDGLSSEAGILAFAAKDVLGSGVYLSFSPTRFFPQIRVGRQTVGSYLGFLWAMVKGGACISATLYLPKDNQVSSSSYIAGILSLPKSRIMEFAPVTAPWVRNTVAGFYLPAKHLLTTGRLWLAPPTSHKDRTAADLVQINEAWIGDLSAELRRIHRDAVGGTLALVTSYQTAADLTKALGPEGAAALVVASEGESLPSQRRRFLLLAHAGHKPLWIAVGAAWTGLNVGGHDPWREVAGETVAAAEDNVLTDLVITRIPHRTNKSMTHAWRMEKNSHVPWDRLDVVFRVRQALGRLVRRSGLPKNRRIHFLDARIHEASSAGMVSALKPVFDGYAFKTIDR